MNRSILADARLARIRDLAALFVAVCAAMPVCAQAPTPVTPPAAPAPPAGAANLNITPRRVVFDRSKRAEAVYVFNQGNAAATFDVTMVDRVMLPSGEILPVSDAATKGAAAIEAATKVHSAKDFLIVSPSRLTLEPGRGKTIRIRATVPDSSDPIEYRTHLTVTTIPPASSGLTAEAAAAARPNELVFRVQSIFGLSIPLIVRAGNLVSSASIGTIRLDHENLSADGTAPARATPVLALEVKRSGDRSLYGNIEARAGTGRSAQVIGVVRGVGLYTEITQREVRIPLAREPKHGESISVAFVDDEAKAGVELAHGVFTAP